MGIDKYNAECRSIVMRYSNEWRKIIGRCGRWIDFDNDYKTLDLNPSVYITFPQVQDPDTSFVAWTTTPWTLPTNLALVVNPTFDYVKVYDPQHKTHFIIAECRLGDLYPTKQKDAYEIKQRYKG